MASFFGKKLLAWHSTIERDLPWKNTNDPYKIWLSEIILQQTRVEQGSPYYLKFIELFPTVHDLASAREDEVLLAWQGLGYYSRARNLHVSAKAIVEQYDGVFPDTYKEILTLKGVGEYTAAAIASFSFNLPYPVLDGNVKRVISRIYGITEPIDDSKTLMKIKTILSSIFIDQKAAQFNQAIMDFGSLMCKPKTPNCQRCTFNNECIAYRKDLVAVIPFKAKKVKRTKRFFHYFIIKENGRTVISKREGNDIWKGLFEFPLVETKSMDLKNPLEKLKNIKVGIENIETTEYCNKYILPKHVLSHQDLFVTIHVYKVQETIKKIKMPYKLVKLNNLKNFAFPRVLTKIMDANVLND